MNTSVITAVGIIIIGFCGCSTQSVDYFPLPQRAQWTYDFQLATSALAPTSGSYISVVDGEQTIEGKRYTRVVNTTKGIPDAETTIGLYRRSSDGIYFRDAAKPEDKESLLLPYPPAIGKRWTNVMGMTTRESRIEGLETVELPGRTYEQSLKISFTMTSPEHVVTGYEYRAPHVGQVRQSIRGSYTADWILSDFRK